ncbi:hypothetical protein E2R56_20205 [Rhodococcus qingshengii]|nr:hypothetical protein E2R56_20205 [Rhodococcus qingshengii]
MMNLSMMKNFLEADSSPINSVLEKWGYDQDSVSFFRASSNFIYTFKRNDKKYILRLTPEGNPDLVEKELSFLTFLTEQQVNVNLPIPSLNGNIIETIQCPLGVFYAVVFNYLEGTLFDIDEIEESHYFLWGEALGNLHHYSQAYSQSQFHSDKHTIQGLVTKAEQFLSSSEVFACKELEVLKSWMNDLPINKQNYGLIHFDFELDNLIWSGEKVQIIDFESSVYGWFSADIAFALRDLFPTEIDLSNPLLQLFLKGYRTKKEITDSELLDLPMFLRLHNLITFTGLLKTLDIKSNTSNPEWVEGLIKKLNTKIENYRNSFS